MRSTSLLALCTVAVALSACSSLPATPQQPARYDLGPGPLAATTRAAAPAAATLPALALGDMQARTQNENSTSVLYRLAYADSQAQRAYAYARWAQPPAVLVQQRLRELLGHSGRTVLSAESSAQPPLVQGRAVPVLQLALEQFDHVFDSPDRSHAAVRLRATLVQPQPRGDVLLGQRVLAVQQAAATPNAAGGVLALTQAVDAVGAQLVDWLAQTVPAAP